MIDKQKFKTNHAISLFREEDMAIYVTTLLLRV